MHSKFAQFIMSILGILSAIFLLFGCNSGGNNLALNSGGPINGSTITVETVSASSEIGGPYNMPYEIDPVTSDGNLYIATGAGALLQVGKDTGIVRTLAGYNGDVISPINLNLVGSNLYAGDALGRIISVFTGQDNYSAIELLYNGHLPGTLNGYDTFGNSTHLFYTGEDGLYAMAYGDYKNPQKVTTYPIGENRIIVTENEIFFGTRNANDKSIYRYELTSGTTSTIQSGIQTYAGDSNPPRMTWHAPYLYWANGSAIDRYNTETFEIQRITSNAATYIENLVADDSTIYAYENYGYPPQMVKVDITSGQTTTIWNSLCTRNITNENGEVFFLDVCSDQSVYRISGNNPPNKFLSWSDVGLPGIWSMSSGNGMLFLTYGDIYDGKVIAYDLATGQMKTFNSLPQSFFYHDQYLYVYYYYGSGALMRFPLDKALRPLGEVSPARSSPGAVLSMVRDENYFYWIWGNFSANDYRVSRVSVESPGPAEDLFQSSSELRNIAIHNGKVYFSCLDNCGDPGWILASVPASGGAVTPEYGLAADPRTFYSNGIFYVADTFDFSERSLFAINLEEGTDVELLNGLFYDGDARDVSMTASSKWFYIGQYRNLPNGMPEKKLSRYKIVDWNHLGNEEIIVNGIADQVESLMPSTISTDGNHLYFWNGAIKRVAE